MTRILTLLFFFVSLTWSNISAQDVSLEWAEPETGDEIRSKIEIDYNMMLKTQLAVAGGTKYTISYSINGGDPVVAVSDTLPELAKNNFYPVPSFKAAFTKADGDKDKFWMHWKVAVEGDVDASNDTITKELTYVKKYAYDLRAEILGIDEKADTLGDITRLTVKLKNVGRNTFYRGSQVQFFFFVNDSLRWNSGKPFLQTYEGETIEPDLSEVYYFKVRPAKGDTVKNKEYCIHVIWSDGQIYKDRNSVNSRPCFIFDGTNSVPDKVSNLESLRYSNGKIYIQLNEQVDMSNNVKVNVHALTGQKVFSGNISTHRSQLSTQQLQMGMYLVSMSDSQGNLISTTRLLVH